jgi:hypothetical protein
MEKVCSRAIKGPFLKECGRLIASVPLPLKLGGRPAQGK